MNRRDFLKHLALLGIGAHAGFTKASFAEGIRRKGSKGNPRIQRGNYYQEPTKRLPVREFDVVIAGGGTAGIVAALAAARQEAKTMLIERK